MQTLLIDIVSWVGLALCIGAFFVKDMLWLRICTASGAALLAIYYSYITIPQGMVSNFMVLGINMIYLGKNFVASKKTQEQPLNNGELAEAS